MLHAARHACASILAAQSPKPTSTAYSSERDDLTGRCWASENSVDNMARPGTIASIDGS